MDTVRDELAVNGAEGYKEHVDTTHANIDRG